MHHSAFRNDKRNQEQRDPLDTLIYKIFKFLSARDRETIKKLVNATPIVAGDALERVQHTLSRISTIVLNHTSDHPIHRDANRQDFITDKIVAYLTKCFGSKLPSTLRIADIGGGNGDVLSNLQSVISDSNPANFFCVETATDWVESYAHNHTNIQYVFWDNQTIPIPDKSCDVVLCMVSLHHMPESTLTTTVSEIARMIKPGGLLLIKEHNARNDASRNLIEWEHHLYHVLDCAYNQEQVDPSKYLEKCVHNFKSIHDWQELMETHGFDHLKTTNRFLELPYVLNDPKNPTFLYWSVFVAR